MNGKSVLRATYGDLKKLPIGALEAFVLSQVHGDTLAEDLAEVTGLGLAELLRVAEHLASLGALSVDGEKRRTKRPTVAPSGRRSTAPASRGEPRASLIPPATIPRPRSHADLRSLGIGPFEGYVLSQIDGSTTVADLGEVTGLSSGDLSAALRALESAGAVDLGRRRKTSAPRAASAPAPPPPSERDACDLSEAERARITEASARFETLSLYGVLGVERDADGKAIRRAYHALAAQFHPDRFFGKKLGPVRRPLERAFVRVTLAYETLSKASKRAEYDATLPPAPVRRPATEKPPAPKRAATVKPPATKRPATVKPPTTKRAATVKPPSTKLPPSKAPPPPPAPKPRSLRPVAPGVPAVSPPRAPPPPPAPAPAPASPAAARAGSSRDRRTPLEHAEVFMRAGQEALDRDDLVAAAHHYRLALQVHDDPRMRALLADIEARAQVRRGKGKRA